jgi:hypothetical protein
MMQGAHAVCGMGTLYQAQEAPEILPAIADIQEHMHRAEDIMTRNKTSYTTCKVEICGIYVPKGTVLDYMAATL